MTEPEWTTCDAATPEISQLTCRLRSLALTHSPSHCAPWPGVWQLARKTNLTTWCQKEAFWAPYLSHYALLLAQKYKWTPESNNDSDFSCLPHHLPLLACLQCCVFLFEIVDFVCWPKAKTNYKLCYIRLIWKTSVLWDKITKCCFNKHPIGCLTKYLFGVIIIVSWNTSLQICKLLQRKVSKSYSRDLWLRIKLHCTL